jgi:predicted esterase
MVTKKLKFADLQARIQAAYQAGEFAAALELAERHAADFPEEAALMSYWRVCMHARLDQDDLALRQLARVLESGAWYGEALLRRSPSLKSLQGLPAFERLVAQARELQTRAQAQRFPLLVLRAPGACQDPQHPCPLLIGLHSNMHSAETSLPLWQPAASAGWLVAAVQSSQAMWSGAYVWDDLEITRQEVLHGYANITRQFAIDPHRTILAGHSMGGEAAIWLALSGAIPACGFLAVGPGGPNMDQPEDWQPWIDQAVQRRATLRGVILTGEADDSISIDSCFRLEEMLNRAGIPCQVETIPHAGHDDLQLYLPAVRRSLDEILNPEL